MRNLFIIVLVASSVWSSCNMEEKKEETLLNYPKTAKVDTLDEYFGIGVEDPYRWLEDDMSDETAQWVSDQNSVTFDYLGSIDFKDKIKDRIRSLLDFERISAPFVEGNYEYWSKNDGLQNHSVLYRKSLESEEEEIFIDPNSFSEDGTTGLAGLSFTKDGSKLAFMITEGGSDWRKAMVMDVQSKQIIEDTLKNIKFSGISWKGNDGFYYSSYDNPEQGSSLSGKTQYHKLYYHKLGTPQNEDELVFGGEAQPNRYIFAGVSEDERYLIVQAAQNTSGNRLYIKDLSDAESDFVMFQEDYMKTASVIDTDGDRILIYTNIDAPKYRLVETTLDNPNQENWENVIPEADDVLSVSSGGGKLFASYLRDAKTAVFQLDMEGTVEREIKLPGLGTAGGFGGKKSEAEFYYQFTSFTYPTTIFKYNIESGESTIYKQPEIDFDPSQFETKQVFYTSKDGTKVPMFIVHKKGITLDGSNPTWLYAYGGFNISLTPSFNPYQLVWLENGGIYAQPNLRGGGEYGEEWHEAGTKMNKQNVFDDFIAAAEYLIAEKYTSSDYLAISGGSNGGLLVGATMTQRPDLMKVALPAVGVLDMLRYHTFTAGAGWAADYGTANDSKEMFEYLKSYSPYHALKEGTAYPATLITTADHDDRVVPAHSFKFAARLQEYNTGPNPMLIRIQTNAGHGSVSTEQRIEVSADQYAFTWYNMGVIPDMAKDDM